ncbi:MAG: hypothetical protein PHZ02_16405 [Desulfocapsaceae bacterium]|nr:hypothetical protein [Desulfocapsaceae bacterium]
MSKKQKSFVRVVIFHFYHIHYLSLKRLILHEFHGDGLTDCSCRAIWIT